MSLSFERREQLLALVTPMRAQASAGDGGTVRRLTPQVLAAAHELLDDVQEVSNRAPRRRWSPGDLNGSKAPPEARAVYERVHREYDLELEQRGGVARASAGGAPVARRYEDMNGTECAQLEHDDPTAHAALRKSWLERGMPDFDPKPAPTTEASASVRFAPGAREVAYEELPGHLAAQLEQNDPETFARLRADWVKRGMPDFREVIE